MKLFVDVPMPPAPALEALLKQTKMPDDHEIVTKELFTQSIKRLLPVAPFLAFAHEDEEGLPD
jgi:hypothetical protein